MNRERWLLLISIIIFLGLAAYYIRPGWLNFLTGGTKSSVAVRSNIGNSGPEKIPAPNFPVASVRGEVDASAAWGRNPFLTEEEAKQVGVEKLRVNTIIVGPPKAVAIIDGHAVMVGEKVNEEKVVEIRPNAVILEREGRKKILNLDEPTLSVAVEERKK